MRKEIMDVIRANPDYLKFIRANPYWYRKLSRDPNLLNEFDLSSKEYFGKTIPHKVSSFSQKLQMASMMINMFQIMREND